MMFIALFGLLTACCTGWLIHPLMQTTQRKEIALILIFLPLAALTLYLWQGRPDLPGKPALFEHDGIRAALRAPVRQEMILMQALAKQPTDTQRMLQLGTVRLRAHHTADALAVLTLADQEKPNDHAIRTALGAAHYMAALDALYNNGGPAAAAPELTEALRIAPMDAPYRAQLLKDQVSAKPLP